MFPKQTAWGVAGACLAMTACERAPGEPTGPEESMSAAVTSNTWSTKRSLTPFRQGMAAGTIDGIIYVAGGRRSDEKALARVDAYNIATDTWSPVAAMPGARINPNGASMIGGKLYVSGGVNATGGPTKTLSVYDPAANTWSRKANVPQAGCGGAQGVISGQLYVYTGCYTEEKSGVMFRYDPATNAWVKRAAPRPPIKAVSAG